MNLLKRFRKNEKGQGGVEYGLILALVSIVSIATLSSLGETLQTKFSDITSAMSMESNGSSSENVGEYVAKDLDSNILAMGLSDWRYGFNDYDARASDGRSSLENVTQYTANGKEYVMVTVRVNTGNSWYDDNDNPIYSPYGTVIGIFDINDLENTVSEWSYRYYYEGDWDTWEQNNKQVELIGDRLTTRNLTLPKNYGVYDSNGKLTSQKPLKDASLIQKFEKPSLPNPV